MPKYPYRRYISETIRRGLVSAGLTQSELARRAGIAPSTVSDYLSGRRCPPPPVVHRLGAAMGVDWRELISRPRREPGGQAGVSELAVPGVELELARGAGVVVDGKGEDTVRLNGCRALPVEDDSMEPLLTAGGLLLISKSAKACSGDLVITDDRESAGGWRCRRYVLHQGQHQLQSLRPGVPTTVSSEVPSPIWVVVGMLYKSALARVRAAEVGGGQEGLRGGASRAAESDVESGKEDLEEQRDLHAESLTEEWAREDEPG